MLNISETVRDAGLILTPYSRMSFRMTLSDLAKYSMTQSARGFSATAELLVN